jgi:hypothetical protein
MLSATRKGPPGLEAARVQCKHSANRPYLVSVFGAASFTSGEILASWNFLTKSTHTPAKCTKNIDAAMGRKRKAGGRPYGQSQPGEFEGSSKLKLDSYEDIADSEDEFAAGRDKILLEEGPEAKRRRKLKEKGRAFSIFICVGSSWLIGEHRRTSPAVRRRSTRV